MKTHQYQKRVRPDDCLKIGQANGSVLRKRTLGKIKNPQHLVFFAVAGGGITGALRES